MCGCDCCQNNDPTCFDPALIDTASPFRTWVCGCTCPNCISNVIRGAKDAGYKIGYGAGLAAARDAVAALSRYAMPEDWLVGVDRGVVLAVIDALKGEQA